MTDEGDLVVESHVFCIDNVDLGLSSGNPSLLGKDPGLESVPVRDGFAQLLLKGDNKGNDVSQRSLIPTQLSLSLLEKGGKPLDGLQVGADVEIEGSQVNIGSVVGIVGLLEPHQKVSESLLKSGDAEVSDGGLEGNDLGLKVCDLTVIEVDDALDGAGLALFDDDKALNSGKEVVEVAGLLGAGEGAGDD